MSQLPTIAHVNTVTVVNMHVACDGRGCPAMGCVGTPVNAGETTASALSRCRAILADRWILAPGLTLCNECSHRPGAERARENAQRYEQTDLFAEVG